MPYKNPEDKKRWEREHRQQRNAMRRSQRLQRQVNVMPDLESDQAATSGWKTFFGFAIGFGFVLLAVLGGASVALGPASGKASASA